MIKAAHHFGLLRAKVELWNHLTGDDIVSVCRLRGGAENRDGALMEEAVLLSVLCVVS